MIGVPFLVWLSWQRDREDSVGAAARSFRRDLTHDSVRRADRERIRGWILGSHPGFEAAWAEWEAWATP